MQRLNMPSVIAVAAVVWIVIGMMALLPFFMMAMIYGVGDHSLQTLTLGLFPVLIIMSGLASLVTAARGAHPFWCVLLLASPLICPIIESAFDPSGNLAQTLAEYGSLLKFWRFMS